MPIKDGPIIFLERKQQQLMDRYAALEDIQGGYPELYSLCQGEMNKSGWYAELIRRKIFGLEESG